ncbi:MAG: 5'-nucleotidase, lipoprotein e(P4) family [Flavobacteriales bacterium]|nr:5'-nucleotidase, lipoprotein e(P4) family [Flavobacteriales bacterium]
MDRSLPIILTLVLLSCAPKQQVVEVPVPDPPQPVDHAAWLSQQGADAALWQNSSAEAYRLFQQGYELARIRMAENIQRSKGPYAVIVDIDETVLDNSPYQVNLVRDGRTYDQASWKEWTDRSSAKASPGALDFLHHAEAAGCEVFYITNRDVRERASTLKNLSDLGFPFADADHLLLMDGASDKTERRAKVAATHRIVLLVGDQLRDFDERFKDRSVNYGKDLVDAHADTLMRYFVLLPNPTYGTYKDAILGKGSEAEKFGRMEDWIEQNGY